MHALEKEMATDSSILAWRIPGTKEPGGLPSMGLQRVRHDWSDLAAAAAANASKGISPCGSDSKESATMQETWIRSLCREYPLEKEMASCSSNLAWKSHGWGNLAGTVRGVTKSLTGLSDFTFIFHSSKVCSKFSKPGFNSTWTLNFRMFKLDLEKAEKPEVKLPTSVGL